MSRARLLLLLLVTLLAACDHAPEHPNVVIITVDTLRADRVGAYGWGAARTTNMDRLAAEGVRFTNAVSSAPITLPSHTSIMTGLLPPAHGVRDNGAYALGDEAHTLAEAFKERGYATQAFVSAAVLEKRYNLDQGFDGYDDDLAAEDDPRLFMIKDRPAQRTADRVLSWLDGRRNNPQPFFLWVHFFDPHQPWEAPLRERLRTLNAYDAEIANADRAIGRILEDLTAQGELDNTVFVVTADHGESLGEHGELTHAIFIYDATVKVPLIIRYPPLLPNATLYEGPARHIDLYPTLLAMAGGKADKVQGVNLLPALTGQEPPPQLPQYSESMLAEVGFGMAPLFGVREDGFKWIRAPRPEVYNLLQDPKELDNLYAQRADIAARLDGDLTSIIAASEAEALRADENPLTQETVEMLQSLGYLQPAAERNAMGGMDPKDGILIYRTLEDARHLAQANHWPEAEAKARELLAQQPGHVSARNLLALVLTREGRFAEAREHYLISLGQQPNQFRLLGSLGRLALRAGDLDEAKRHLEAAIALTPDFVDAYIQLGYIAYHQGDKELSHQWIEKALNINESGSDVLRRVADLFYLQQEYPSALEYYRLALKQAPDHYHALLQAGNAAVRAGQGELAEPYWRQAMALRPDVWTAAYNLAVWQSKQGELEAAETTLTEAVTRGLNRPELLRDTPEFAPLQERPKFKELLTKLASAPAPKPDRRPPAN